MKVIRKINDKIDEVEYPRKSISKPIVGLEKGITFYFISEFKRPSYNPQKSYLRSTDTLTEKRHPEYSHLFLCERGWDIIDYSQDEIINKLNKSLGEHLDSEYPLWKRQKHSNELILGTNTERESYIKRLIEWENSQRIERDIREKNYLNSNIIPSFEWEQIPRL